MPLNGALINQYVMADISNFVHAFALMGCLRADIGTNFGQKNTGAIHDGAGTPDLMSEGESEQTAIVCGGNESFATTERGTREDRKSSFL